ncbi:tellurium resistance protein [Bacillus sp. M6-12]|uniref:TerD family protein n=1 Tax=Bacillus sp. M6-12 TaxID=2054166 RepID=UPI000C779F90|nr:TerD family protein [Bacillus sp. M6-12]PLS16772.1 tellurium resistance protein [Bacillus sp. M6-12]
MSVVLVKGQKSDITKLNPNIRTIRIELDWRSTDDIELDASAFLIGLNGKVKDDSDFVFYGQPSSSCKSVTKINTGLSTKQNFQVSLHKIPAEVQKIVFSLTIYKSNESFRQISDINIRVIHEQTNQELLCFPVPISFTEETAIVVGEVYRNSGHWKFNSVGAGYFGGLAALCKSYGVDVEEPQQTSIQPQQTHQATQKPESNEPSGNPAVSIVNISKIELKKKQSVNIKKSQRITATLEWETAKDLDLYCFYVLKNGQSGKVYYRDLGSSNHSPFIRLDGDSQEFGKETIEIYKTDELAYVLFAAYSAVSNGVGSFYSMRAKAVVDNHMGNVVIAPLLEYNDRAYWVALAHIDFTDGQAMKVSHVERYSRDNSEASPMLYNDGSFRMDVGPIEFKDEEDYLNYFGQ